MLEGIQETKKEVNAKSTNGDITIKPVGIKMATTEVNTENPKGDITIMLVGIEKTTTERNAKSTKGIPHIDIQRVTTVDNTEVRDVNLINILTFYNVTDKWLMISAISAANEGEYRPEWQKWWEQKGFDEGENTLANEGLWWPSPMPGFSGRRGTEREGNGR